MKLNFINKYFQESWFELKKVKWPTRQEIVTNTVIVILSAAVATALVAAIDLGLSKLVEYLVSTNQ